MDRQHTRQKNKDQSELTDGQRDHQVVCTEDFRIELQQKDLGIEPFQHITQRCCQGI